MNKKGGVGELVLFLFEVSVIAMFVIVIYGTQSGNEELISVEDTSSKASLVKDGIINSPECLLYTETKTIGGETVRLSWRGIIDWNKINSLEEDCVKTKSLGDGKVFNYLWKIKVKDLDDGSEMEKGSSEVDLSEATEVPVTIKKGGELHRGVVYVAVKAIEE